MNAQAPRVGLTQRADDIAGRDERRDSLDQNWMTVLALAGCRAVPIPNRVDDAELLLDEFEFDLVILTGGNDIASLADAANAAPERDALERSLLAAARRLRLPVLGACRGMQMMVVESGGTLTRVDDHVRRPHPLSVTTDAAEHGLPLLDGRCVNSFHEWGVLPAHLGRDFEPAALGPDGTVEAMRHTGLPHVGIMWHPERVDPSTGSPGAPSDIEMIHYLLGIGR